MYLVISCSLNPVSRSRILARTAYDSIVAANQPVEWIDLRDDPLVICDGSDCYANPRVQAMADKIREAEGVLMAVPIYNYDVNAAAKNLVELTGKAWLNKLVGFLCAAGGRSSYMSVMGLANSLILDFRCLILPRFVYATRDDFDGDQIQNENIVQRIQELTETFLRLAAALKEADPSSDHP